MLSLSCFYDIQINKNFQDYFTNIVIQRTGAEMYTDGIKKSLVLPYEDFEDLAAEKRSRLQKLE
jgi:ATP-binding cassette subfamily B protein